MRVSGAWIDAPATQAVCAMLVEAGHVACFVGGCVRNALIGAGVDDIDIATDARPDRVIALAGAAGLRAVPTGIAHGTVTVISGGTGHEITTFRRDAETFGRHAAVVYADRIEEDAARRDFTMNALYARPDGTVLDPLGGLPDLLARRVRFVGDPAARIVEDYLRILRFFRFHAWYGDAAGGIDGPGLEACAAHAEGLEQLSRERIGAEIRKMLRAPDPGAALVAMERAGVLGRVLPGASAAAFARLQARDPAPRWLRRLAVLGVGTDAVPALRLSRQEGRALGAILAAARTEGAPARLGYRFGAACAEDGLLLRAARDGGDLPEGWRLAVARGASAVFPLRAADLADDLAGPALGARLRELEERWIASDFGLDRAALLSG